MDERLHNGGAMAFGNDGKLYITTGDAGNRKNAGTFDDVHGSIIRLNEDGTVPDDNPYTKASGYKNSYRCADTEGRVPKNAPDDSYCAEVWANGLRNPFRIDMDPNVKDKVKFSFGVVGAQHIEALYYGGTDYKGTNYGWPKYEGVCRPGDIYDCEPNDDDPTLTMPFHWYEHISYEDGGCVGGQAHVPEGIWPPEFKYLFLDFIHMKIYSLEVDRPDEACQKCSPPLPPTRNETFYRSIQKEGDNVNQARLVEMWFGPYKDTQALYVTKFGNYDTVIRIRYNGVLNKPPKPAFSFNNDGEMTVNFDASLTSDPEGDKLKYQWDFGDDSPVKNKMITSHRYAQPGEYAVTLMVTDTSGQKQQVSETVKVGTVPKVKILLPLENATFAVGQSLRLKGEAVDSLGNSIPDERLTWEVRQHHADHFHPFLDPKKGNNFSLFAAPEPEDYLAATNSFLKVLLTAEDEFGLTETESIDVQPTIIMVNVTTQPSGLEIVIDDYDIEAPQLITSWEGFNLPVTVADQPPYLFKEWSDGETNRTRKFPIYQQVNESLPQVRAVFCADFAAECEKDENCCSGYCSAQVNGICVPMPETLSPTFSPTSAPYELVKDPPASDLEINVITPPYTTEKGRLPLELDPTRPILDEESYLSNTTSVSFSNSNNDNSNLQSGMVMDANKWMSFLAIALLILASALFASCCASRIKDNKHINSEPKNGSDDNSFGDRDLKNSRTSVTEESGSYNNFAAQTSTSVQDDGSNNSNISLSFLNSESNSSDLPATHDVENQACESIDAQNSAFEPSTSLILSSSQANSVEHPKLRCFDDVEEQKEKKVTETLEYRFDPASTSQSSLIVPPSPSTLNQKSFDGMSGDLNAITEGIIEYRFDAASTSQSSLILPPQSTSKSFEEVPVDRSVSLSMDSPEKCFRQSILPTKITPADDIQSVGEDSFDERDLGETSLAIESIVLNYLSEMQSTQNESNNDDLKSSLPKLSESSEASQEGIDEDELVLDLLLSTKTEEEFVNNIKDLDLSLPHTESGTNQDINSAENLHDIQEYDVEKAITTTGTEITSGDSTKLSEDSFVQEHSCDVQEFDVEKAITTTDTEITSGDSTKPQTVDSGNSDKVIDVALSSPNAFILQPKHQGATSSLNFLSPDMNTRRQEEKETPETVSMSFDAIDSSVDDSFSVEMGVEMGESHRKLTYQTGFDLQILN